MRGRRRRWEELWAVNGVSFDVHRGEVVGLVGRNGSGKTTLLQLIAGILWPDTGEIQIRGRLSTLLELGAGFHPEYTGRENIYLYAGLLGLRRSEIARRFNEIAAFSELDGFIDQPLKTYSAGMQVRLGFSVAAHVDAETLLIDEVLAVGDAGFHQKCLDHLTALKRRGCTIILVSHDLRLVKAFCGRALWMDQGSVMVDGEPDQAIDQYLAQVAATAPAAVG